MNSYTAPPAAEPSDVAMQVAWGALLEIGRRDLADGITGWECDHGFYLEYNDDILDEADWELISRAENMGRQAVGQVPIVRDVEGRWVSP